MFIVHCTLCFVFTVAFPLCLCVAGVDLTACASHFWKRIIPGWKPHKDDVILRTADVAMINLIGLEVVLDLQHVFIGN